jgi:calcineurin-like phosphoesterase family protein
MGKIFYTSDLHLGHKNAIRFDNRPWNSIDEMDEGLIERWNKKVSPDDTVYILGDISWYKDIKKTVSLLKRLNGKKILIRGNHDYSNKPELVACFEYIKDYDEIQDGKYNVVLCHYPILFYKNQRYGWIHLYGHLHIGMDEALCNNMIHQLKDAGINAHMYNVGTMLWNFEPVTLEEIFAKVD